MISRSWHDVPQQKTCSTHWEGIKIYGRQPHDATGKCNTHLERLSLKLAQMMTRISWSSAVPQPAIAPCRAVARLSAHFIAWFWTFCWWNVFWQEVTGATHGEWGNEGINATCTPVSRLISSILTSAQKNRLQHHCWWNWCFPRLVCENFLVAEGSLGGNVIHQLPSVTNINQNQPGCKWKDKSRHPANMAML